MSSNQQHEWTYDDNDECGPKEWPKYYKTGDHQSPINILIDPQSASYHAITCCAGRLKETLQIITNDSNKRNHDSRHQQSHAIYRTHLDSIGEHPNGDDYNNCESSSPPGSTTSSNRSSPTQASGSDYFDEDDSSNGEKDDGYSGQNKKNKKCNNGQKKQIFRIRQNTRFCISNKKMFLGYPRYLNSMELENTGHSWQVTLPKELTTHTRKLYNELIFKEI